MAKDLNMKVVLDVADKVTSQLKGITKVSKKLAQATKENQVEFKDLSQLQKKLQGFDALRRDSESTSQAMREQQNRMAALTRQIETTNGSTKRLIQQRNAAARAEQKLRNKYEQQTTQMADVRRKLDQVKGLTGTLSDKEAELARRIEAVNERLSRQRAALKRLGDADVGGKFSKMTHEVGSLFRRLMFGGGAAAGGIFALANSTAQLGDNVAKTADKLGVGTDELQEYRYAAERSGVSTQKFDSSFERFVKRTGEAAQGTGAAKKAYEELGLSAKKLAKMMPDEAFAVVADRLKEVKNQTDRVAYSADFFGREGVAMVNMIRGGSEGLRELRRDARRTGYVLSEQAARDAEVFSDRLLDAKLSLAGMKNTIGAELMPALSDLMRDYSSWARQNRDVVREFAKNFGERLNSALPVIADIGRGLVATVQGISRVTSRLAHMVGGFENLGMVVGTVFAGKAIASILSFGGALFKAGTALLSLTGALPAVQAGIKAISIALATNPLTYMVTGLAIAGYLIYRNWGDISAFFADRWADIKAAFAGGTSEVAKLLLNWNPVGLLYRAVTAGLELLGVEVPAKYQTLGNAIINGIGGALTSGLDYLINDLPRQFLNLGSQIVNGIIDGITAQAGALKNSVLNLGGNVSGWFKDKLGIRSPSRVFMAHGRNTLEGYRLGVAAREPAALQQITAFARRATVAGAGVGLLGSAAVASAAPVSAAYAPSRMMPAVSHASEIVRYYDRSAVDEAPSFAIDTRPPIAASANSSTNINLNFGDVHIHNGRDENAFMARVRSEVEYALDARERRAAVARRSALYD